MYVLIFVLLFFIKGMLLSIALFIFLASSPPAPILLRIRGLQPMSEEGGCYPSRIQYAIGQEGGNGHGSFKADVTAVMHLYRHPRLCICNTKGKHVPSSPPCTPEKPAKKPSPTRIFRLEGIDSVMFSKNLESENKSSTCNCCM